MYTFITKRQIKTISRKCTPLKKCTPLGRVMYTILTLCNTKTISEKCTGVQLFSQNARVLRTTRILPPIVLYTFAKIAHKYVKLLTKKSVQHSKTELYTGVHFFCKYPELLCTAKNGRFECCTLF